MEKVLDVSLNRFFHVTQPLLLPMLGTRWGRIVSISSLAGVMGNRGQTNYAAAKSGLHGASKSLAIELASWHYGQCGRSGRHRITRHKTFVFPSRSRRSCR